MDITTPEDRFKLFSTLAIAHTLASVLVMTFGWLLMHSSQPSFVAQPSGQFATTWPWSWYIGICLIVVGSAPLLLPGLLLLPESWAFALLLLLPVNSVLIGYGLGRWYIHRRIRKGDWEWRIQHWQCPACGYDLTGSMDATNCPECGAYIPEKLRKQFDKLRSESRAYRPPE